MIGFSINLTDDLDYILSYIRQMKEAGFKNAFTTIYEPGEDKEDFLNKVNEVGKICHDHAIKLTLGLSKESAKEVNLDLSPALFEEMYIDGIRVTPQISNKTIAKFSKELKVALSASHINEDDLREIEAEGGRLENIEAWFYYYEREEIGLSLEYMLERIEFWESMGIQTAAFVPGDDDLSGDFAPRLSLEKHRGKHPLYATIDLLDNICVNSVYIGDSMINEKTMSQFKTYMETGLIVYYADVLDHEYFELIKGRHRNRIDEAENVIRAEDPIDIKGTRIVDRYLMSRPRGSMTIDNHRNGRFMGEFHITKVDLDLSNSVNLVAHVRERDIDLLEICRGGSEFEIIENEIDL